MPSEPRLLLACVGENRERWFQKIRNLVVSVRLFGEGSSDIPVVTCFVGGVEGDFARELERQDAEVRVVEPVDARAPSANKLRMLELVESHEFDVLLMLDCDVIVRGDLAPAVSTSRLRVAPAIGNPYSPTLWRTIYEGFGLPEPTERVVMTMTGERTHPYYNSGVMFVPRDLCLPLKAEWDAARNQWFDFIESRAEMFRSKHGDRDTVRQDQPPLACALARAGIEVDPLPINLNLRTFGPGFARAYRHQWGPPFIFHYHDRMDADGFLRQSPRRRVAPYLDDFNRRRAKELGLGAPPPLKPPELTTTLRSVWRNARKRARFRTSIRRS